MSFDKDAVKKHIKGSLSLDPKESLKEVTNPDPANVFRTGKTAAKKAQAKQSLLIEKQRQREEVRLSEETDEIARRKALSRSSKAGRRSLIQTSESGAATLGGS